jgi:hypothetical protein
MGSLTWSAKPHHWPVSRRDAPITIEEDQSRCAALVSLAFPFHHCANLPDQVQPHATSLRAQQEDEALILILPIERVHQTLPLFRRCTTVEAEVGVSLAMTEILDDVERCRPV